MFDVEILVLEDEALIAVDIEMTLNDAGHSNVAVCHSAEKAMKLIDSGGPKMALLDFNLGYGKNSLEVARRLKDLNIPFAFLSGYTEATVAMPDDLNDVKRISKPFQRADLQEVIGALLLNI